MATSSITKQFVISDPEVFYTLLKSIEDVPAHNLQKKNGSVLDAGREALKRFIPRNTETE